MEGKIIPPQLMEAWGCGFPAGTRQAGLTLERLQPPKSLSVPSCSHGSALTHSTHPSPPQQGPEPGWVPRAREIRAELRIAAPSQSTDPTFHTGITEDVLSANCP